MVSQESIQDVLVDKENREERLLAYFRNTEFSCTRSVVLTHIEGILIRCIDEVPGITGAEFTRAIEKHFTFTISPGTLYPVIHELKDKGIIERAESVRQKHLFIADEKRAYKRLNEDKRQAETITRALAY